MLTSADLERTLRIFRRQVPYVPPVTLESVLASLPDDQRRAAVKALEEPDVALEKRLRRWSEKFLKILSHGIPYIPSAASPAVPQQSRSQTEETPMIDSKTQKAWLKILSHRAPYIPVESLPDAELRLQIRPSSDPTSPGRIEEQRSS